MICDDGFGAPSYLVSDITTKRTDHDNDDEYFIYTDRYVCITSKTNTKWKQIKKGINKDGKKFEMAKTYTEPFLFLNRVLTYLMI